MSETKLQAEMRTEFGKGAARRIRRDAKVPAVLYEHGQDPMHITLPGHDTMLALKHGGANALLAIEVGGDSHLAIPKQVQRDPIKGFLEHVDLLLVRKGEKVIVEVPIVIVGDAERETLVTLEVQTVSLEAEATNLPESIEVSVEGAVAGTQILARDLQLPSGAVLQTDEEALMVHVTASVEMDTEAATDEGDAADVPEVADSSADAKDDSAE